MTNTLLDLSKQTDLQLVGQMAGEILAEADKLGEPVFMAGAMACDLILQKNCILFLTPDDAIEGVIAILVGAIMGALAPAQSLPSSGVVGGGNPEMFRSLRLGGFCA